MDPNRITYFAETDARNKKIRFGIKAKDRLKHMYVIGKTGMGKSTLLENLAIQDIQNGEGLAVIDPHGSMAEKLLDYVPEHRIKDVLYFAPFDMEFPVSFNVMEDVGVDKRHLLVNGLMSVFEKIWEDAWSARMAYILQNTLLALIEFPGATLLAVNRMYTDKEFRRQVVENVKDVTVKTFWTEEYAKYTDKYVQEATPAIQNKIGQFASHAMVRNIIGQPKSTFDIRKAMDERKVLIINLSKGRLGEGNANLLGSMLITKIYLAAMSRADSSEQDLSKLPNFYLYVDEFQSFANKSFADILSEARKYKLNLTIAHQYIEQMEEEVRDAVFGNVGTMITFRVGAFDAEVLEKEFAPVFTAEDLVNLGFTQIYLKLMIDGVSSSPFSATTMGPIARPEKNCKEQIITSSREQFAHPRTEVEEGIKSWHEEGASGTRPSSGTGISGNTGPSYGRSGQNMSQGEYRNGGQGGYSNNRNGERNNFKPRNDAPPPPRQEELDLPSPKALPLLEEAHNDEQKNAAPPIDPNKLAFQKASEMLRAKENEVSKPNISEQKAVSEQKTETPVAPIPLSLSGLRKGDEKKIPTKENLATLKDALSLVLQKPVAPKTDVKPLANPLVQEVKTEVKQETTAEDKGVEGKGNEVNTYEQEKKVEKVEKVEIKSEINTEKKPAHHIEFKKFEPQKVEEKQEERIEEKKEKIESKTEPATNTNSRDVNSPEAQTAREIPEEVLRNILSLDSNVEVSKTGR